MWLGDPRSHLSEGRKIWIEGVKQERINAAESVSYNADKLALNLLSALFSTTDLATGNCTSTKEGGHSSPRPKKKILGIRRKLMFKL